MTPPPISEHAQELVRAAEHDQWSDRNHTALAAYIAALEAVAVHSGHAVNRDHYDCDGCDLCRAHAALDAVRAK